MLQGSPTLLELGGSPFPEGTHAPDQDVSGSGVRVQGLFGAALGAPDRDEDADPGADVALVGEGGQALGRGLVQGGQPSGAASAYGRRIRTRPPCGRYAGSAEQF